MYIKIYFIMQISRSSASGNYFILFYYIFITLHYKTGFPGGILLLLLMDMQEVFIYNLTLFNLQLCSIFTRYQRDNSSHIQFTLILVSIKTICPAKCPLSPSLCKGSIIFSFSFFFLILFLQSDTH